MMASIKNNEASCVVVYPLHEEDFSLIDELVDDSVRDGVVGKDLIKLPERQAGCGNSARPLFMPRGCDLEEQIARLSIQLYATESGNVQHLKSLVD